MDIETDGTEAYYDLLPPEGERDAAERARDASMPSG